MADATTPPLHPPRPRGAATSLDGHTGERDLSGLDDALLTMSDRVWEKAEE